MTLRLPACLAALFCLSSCVSQISAPPPARVSIADRPLRLASWNLEFLAEKDGEGCEPRTADDYAAMRRMVDTLDPDVVAFQEAETPAAAARIFDPVRYVIVMEARPDAPSGNCGGKHADKAFIRQAVGFAVRKDIAFDRHPDVKSLMLANPQLRSGIDITLRPKGHDAIRLLGIHLKSGCFSGRERPACPVLFDQVPALEAWINAAALSTVRFAVLGDWNRQLATAGDAIWSELDDGDPANADLRLADAGVKPGCDPRYGAFIDHIALDRRAGKSLIAFNETRYAPDGKHYSDHCPVSVALR